MLTIVFFAAIFTVFLFGLWLRLQALQQKIGEVAELLLPLLRDEHVMASAEPTDRKPVILPNGAVRFEP
jgi:hypothetical protein